MRTLREFWIKDMVHTNIVVQAYVRTLREYWIKDKIQTVILNRT